VAGAGAQAAAEEAAGVINHAAPKRRCMMGSAGIHPSKLRSLWDMLEIDAYRFVGFLNAIHSIRWMAEQPRPSDDFTIRGRDETAKSTLIDGGEQLAEMGLNATRNATLDFLSAVESHGSSNQLAINHVGIVCHILMFELKGRAFLQVQRQDLFEKGSALFGPDLPIKFPDASFEIDEGGKCLALERGTACVFHLMRAMEIAVRATARCLQISDPIKPSERNWGFILGEIKKGIDARWPTAASRHGGDGAFFETLYASLSAVRNPWRNATMHVEKRYTVEEADDVLAAVRGFMRLLASRLDEQGQPLA